MTSKFNETKLKQNLILEKKHTERAVAMHRKRTNFNGDERQLKLRFRNNDVVIVKETPANKVVEFLSKLKRK